MPIDIQFSDFDTVCYSSEHNLMELIRRAVGISVEINITQSNLEQTTAQLGQLEQEMEGVAEKAQEGHDAFLLVENLNQRVSAVERKVSSIENMDAFFYSTALGEELQSLRSDVHDLKEAVFGG